ncbi:MAG: hypothetical protein ACJAUP_000582 [Cellvibrionaceae bacterium]|jgi:hypothetical protein
MSKTHYKKMVLDARPDRLDLRDREYRPHLQSLPGQFPPKEYIQGFLPCYKDNGLILDQGQEGACTGFGLAATINYLIWRDKMDFGHDADDLKQHSSISQCDLSVKESLVSERMLYHMAKVYDEWDGEDYSGSSCRGAMKGWHRHGVCKKSLWEYDTSGKFIPPKNETWAVDALATPLGAYYRINHQSVVDMQAAILEVGALYCSADVHEGWWLQKTKSLEIISQSEEMIGGHAFCIIGYTQEGFIIQNSWGDTWGWNGFAILTYSDWIENGSDAWIVARGVPVKQDSAPRMFSNNALQDVASKRSDPKQASINKALKYPYSSNFDAKPWTEDQAYAHALVISNNGRPKHTVIASEGPDTSAEHICYTNLRNWLQASVKNRKIAIYAHGGLNSEESSINRVRVMAPYFKANDIYPLFVVWKTGLSETLSNIIKESGNTILDQGPDAVSRAEGFSEWVSDKTDRAIETIARGIQAKSLWSEMKENALYACDRAVPGFVQNKAGKPGAMVILAKALEKINKEFPDIEIHMVGHSAGSILLGSWLKELTKRKLSAQTVSLFAPACTIEFTNKTFIPAIEKGTFKKKSLFIHSMDDEREKSDNTGKLYRKSLLYLVSRALEDLHKMPLLGMAAAWDPNNCEDKMSGGFHHMQRGQVEKWCAFIEDANKPILYGRDKSQVKINLKPDYIDLSHGSFDNDIDVVEFTLKKIKGSSLKTKVVNLCGY